MPTIQSRNASGVSSQDVMKIAVYAEYVATQCFDIFKEDGSKSRSETLSVLAQAVSDYLDFGDEPRLSLETTQSIIDLRNAVLGMCFDKFGDRCHMGKSLDLIKMDQEVSDVLDKLIDVHLSAEEVEQAEADWAHESQFFVASHLAGREDVGYRTAV